MKHNIILVLFLTFSFLDAFGQSKQCDCSEALNESLKNQYTEKQLLDLRIELYEYYLFLKNNTSSDASSFELSSEGEAFTNYGIFSGTMDSKNQRNKNKTDNLKKIIEKEQSISEEVFKQIVVDVFSDNQLEAYKACLNSCTDQNGVFYEISGDLSDVFAVTVSFKNTVGKELVTLKNNATLINCDPVGGFILKEGESILNGRSITQYFRIVDTEKNAQIGLNFEELAFFPIDLGNGFRRNHDNAPIGTIISSVLDYHSFLELNNLEDTKNMSEAVWVPCDGRNVSSSEYGNFVGNVPDLRGVFLRGVNEFGVSFPGVNSVNARQANPEGTRAGVFQEESFKAHTHNLGDAGEVDWESNRARNRQRVRNSGGSGIITSSTGGNETRPKNVTVYYYIKIN